MIQGVFYEVEWDLGQFNAEELGLPVAVFSTKNEVTNKFFISTLEKSNIFLYEESRYPSNGLIMDVLEDRYKNSVNRVSILEQSLCCNDEIIVV